MWKNKLIINVGIRPIPVHEQIDLIARLGFDGFFTPWADGFDVVACRKQADALGLFYQSIHAPFKRCADLWTKSEAGDEAEKELMRCVDACVDAGVDLCVMHLIIGFDKFYPNEHGKLRFERIAQYAKEKGVRIALENTEGEGYLASVMETLYDYENVGFCWDTGHEMCYNRSQDLLDYYGDRLFCTHLNDNLGIRSAKGEITYHDDLHLLPFDGVADWEDIAARLVRHGFNAPLTFEIKWDTRIWGCDEPYYPYTFEQYMQHAYAAACRFAALVEKKRAKR